jgi:diguanylate cyclase
MDRLKIVKLTPVESSPEPGLVKEINRIGEKGDNTVLRPLRVRFNREVNGSRKLSAWVVECMKKKILIVEDENALRKTVIKILSSEGFEAIGAENGSIGVTLAQTEQPDLILCDIMMPELDGYQVLTILQQDPTTAMIPFICLTAQEDRSSMRRGMELGASDYLTKPFTRNELMSAIASQLAKRERLKQEQNDALQEVIAQLNALVYYDSLTNLPNRLMLRDRFERTLSSNPDQPGFIPFAILSLDQFNRFNNTLGSEYSDLLLQAVTERTLRYVGPEGTVARLNSEQLALILPPLREKPQVEETARHILGLFSHGFRILSDEVFLTSSIGIALYPDDGQEIDSLLKSANLAMHQAKEQGGNCYQLYTSAIEEKSYDRLMLEMHLRQALDRNEFILYYQPQVHLQTGKIVAAEALIRWLHPDRGLISPGEFIPLAEETGLIVRLDEWVLQNACEQAKIWQQAGYQITIAVNLSGLQFNQPGLTQRVIHIIRESQVNPCHVEIELTESALVQNPELAICILRDLKNFSLQLSLDDFGTGYSSLSYLQKFPFDTLKIDRSFVADLMNSSKNAAIINAIIQLAKQLNLKVIAEGVETRDQYDFLRQNNCDLIQGYYFSPPLPVAAFEELLTEQMSHSSFVKDL